MITTHIPLALSFRSPLTAREAGKFLSGAVMSSVSTLSLRVKEGIKFVGPFGNLAQVVLRWTVIHSIDIYSASVMCWVLKFQRRRT